jgi:glycosyltransferase involved in cell wall biosynthesis
MKASNIKRVGHILPFPGIGGTEVAALRIMKTLEPFGFESVAICLHDFAPLRELFRAAGIPSPHWAPPQPSYRHAARFLAASRSLAAEFRRLRLDLIHCQDYGAALHTALAGRLAGVPVLCHVRNRHPKIPRRERAFLIPVSHFVFVSQSTWEQFGCPVQRGKGSVVHCGVEVLSDAELAALQGSSGDVRAEFGLPPDAKLVGMVARVAPQKDFDTLIRAAVGVIGCRPETRFLVVGDTDIQHSHYEQVHKWLFGAGMEKHFVFTGHRADVSRLMSALDVAVLSTHFEGLPHVLLQAMALGKPVVATAVDGIPELISHNVTGLLYPHGDAEALAQRLVDLLDDPELAAQIGRAARRSIQADFSEERFAGDIAALYARLLT